MRSSLSRQIVVARRVSNPRQLAMVAELESFRFEAGIIRFVRATRRCCCLPRSRSPRAARSSEALFTNGRWGCAA